MAMMAMTTNSSMSVNARFRNDCASRMTHPPRMERR